MSDIETQQHVSLSQVDRRPVDAASTETNMSQCLVVSTSMAKRDMLSESANRGGWDTVVCSDEENALFAFRKIRFRMAFVDLEKAGNKTKGFRNLCESIAQQPNLLLTICGSETDPQEEIWARQLGVWLYLPGVHLEHSDELTEICEQAQLVAGLPTNNEMF